MVQILVQRAFFVVDELRPFIQYLNTYLFFEKASHYWALCALKVHLMQKKMQTINFYPWMDDASKVISFLGGRILWKVVFWYYRLAWRTNAGSMMPTSCRNIHLSQTCSSNHISREENLMHRWWSSQKKIKSGLFCCCLSLLSDKRQLRHEIVFVSSCFKTIKKFAARGNMTLVKTLFYTCKRKV